MAKSNLSEEMFMRRALELAALGEGFVEPNPMVGAVVVDDEGSIIGEGYHQRFGGPHAEVHALRHAGTFARGATLFVTLEPCCHYGKTPPCTEAVIQAGIRRVIVAKSDPYPEVAGQGIARLRQAGIRVDVGLLGPDATELLAPFSRLIIEQKPFIIAKWAMSLDGKLAAYTGMSQWISNSTSRARVQKLRGRMDGILVGIGTVLADNPRLTARPADLSDMRRAAQRIVLDTRARLPTTCKLVESASETPVLLCAGEDASPEKIKELQDLGVEIELVSCGENGRLDPCAVLLALGKRRLTNILVEGGAEVLGTFRDANEIQEAHVFVAPQLMGGANAPSPIGGIGATAPAVALRLNKPQIEILDHDVYIHGRVDRLSSEKLTPGVC